MKINKLQLNPVFARINSDDKVDGDEFEIWYEEKFQKASLEVRLGIGGDTVEEEIQKICEKFGISDWQKIGYTARIIRDIFCDDLKEDGIKKIAIENINIEKADLAVFLQLIKEIVKKIKQAGEKEYTEIIDKLTLKEAVRLYPEIQKQQISEKALRPEGSEYLVAGNVKNWLTNYFQEVGGNKHSSLERSDYLFKSKSVKGLDQDEIENLGVILKAFDDDSLVAVDKEFKEIDFNESRALDNGKRKLNGIMKSYDNNLENDLVENKGIERISKQPEYNLKQKDKFEKIESTPRFEVDGNSKKNNSEIPSNNVISLKQTDPNLQVEKKEKKKSRSENDQNVLDLSDFV